MIQAYVIRHIATDRVRYVGVTSRSIKKRWTEHKCKRCCTTLANALRGYGHGAFRIEVVACAINVEAASELEAQLITQHNTLSPAGYNLTTGGEGHYKRTLETIERMKKAQKGRTFTPESIAKMSASRKGKTLTPEHKAKVGRPGRPQSPELRAKRAAAQIGRVMSPETRAKISATKRAGAYHGTQKNPKPQQDRCGVDA